MDSLIIKCFQLAAAGHAFDNQERKWSGVPYITHPFRVACRVMLIPEVPEYVVGAAVLHDFWEDCKKYIASVPPMDIPMEVVELARWLTNPTKEEYGGANRAARKRMNAERLAKAPIWAKRIKVIDRIDNLNDMGSGAGGPTRGFFFKYLDESESLLRAIVTPYEDDTHLVLLGAELDHLITDLRKKLEVESEDCSHSAGSE